MITKRRFIIPIYKLVTYIYVFDSQEEAQSEIPNYPGKSLGCVQIANDGSECRMCIPYGNNPVAVHEAEHLKNAVWDSIGYKPDVRNDEHDAYMIEYIWEQVEKTYDKHRRNLATQC